MIRLFPNRMIPGAGGAVVALASLLSVLATPLLAQDAPKRIVAAGGVVTEIVYALGRQDRLVGVDATSQFPSGALKAHPSIGYVRALSAEGILSLNPDLILAIEGAGPPDVLRLIGEARIAVRKVPEEHSESGVLERIRVVGDAVGAQEAAAHLAQSVKDRFAQLAKARDALGTTKRVLFVLSIQNGRVLVGGRNSSAAAIIALAGGINAAEGIEGFKPLSDEGLIAATPDVIVMMQRGDHAASPDDVFALPAFKALPAARTRALISMDGLYLLGFGPRTPDAAQDLMREIAKVPLHGQGKRAEAIDGKPRP